jgi:ABC-2 type transport system permease protein
MTLQALTFMRKEINDAFHQPRLLLALVFGPFLIMAVFAMGYRNAAPPLRTFIVVPENSPLEQQAKSYADALTGYVKMRGVGSDYNKARRDLEEGRIDVVVAFPADPMQELVGGQHAKI